MTIAFIVFAVVSLALLAFVAVRVYGLVHRVALEADTGHAKVDRLFIHIAEHVTTAEARTKAHVSAVEKALLEAVERDGQANRRQLLAAQEAIAKVREVGQALVLQLEASQRFQQDREQAARKEVLDSITHASYLSAKQLDHLTQQLNLPVLHEAAAKVMTFGPALEEVMQAVIRMHSEALQEEVVKTLLANAFQESTQGFRQSLVENEAQLTRFIGRWEAMTNTLHAQAKLQAQTAASIAQDTDKLAKAALEATNTLWQDQLAAQKTHARLDGLVGELQEAGVRQAAQEADHRSAASELRSAKGDFLQAAQTLASWSQAADEAVRRTVRIVSDQDMAAGIARQAAASLKDSAQEASRDVERLGEGLGRLEALQTALQATLTQGLTERGLTQLDSFRAHARDAVAFAEQHDKKARQAGGAGLTNDHKRTLARQFAEKNLRAVGITLDTAQQELLAWEIEAAVNTYKES